MRRRRRRREADKKEGDIAQEIKEVVQYSKQQKA